MNRWLTRELAAVLLLTGVGLWIASCSAVLDTDELQQGTPDGSTKDVFQPPTDGEPPLDGQPQDGLTDAEPYAASVMNRTLPASGPAERLALTPESESTRTASLTFRWEDIPGRPADTDLTIVSESVDTPLFQVFARNNTPFARAGLKIVRLAPNVRYRLDLAVEGRGSAERVTARLQRLDAVVEQHALSMPAPSGLNLDAALVVALGTTDNDKRRAVLNPAPTPDIQAAPRTFAHNETTASGVTLATIR